MKLIVARSLILFSVFGLTIASFDTFVKGLLSFDECTTKDSGANEECFTKPTNQIKNALNKCKCEVFTKLGIQQAVSNSGKKKPCSLQFPDPISMLNALLPALAFPINFKVKMCFWKKMDLTKSALTKEIDICLGDSSPDLPAGLGDIPLLKEIIDKFMDQSEFAKCCCMGNAFGKVCKDVTNFDLFKVGEKFKNLPRVPKAVVDFAFDALKEVLVNDASLDPIELASKASALVPKLGIMAAEDAAGGLKLAVGRK